MTPSPAAERRITLASFAGFGLVWGCYAAALPAIKSATGASDAVLGAALTSIGVAALPAMTLAGRLLDRLGRRVSVAAAAAFAVTTAAPAFVTSVPSLVITLVLFGACSGAFDVSINSAAVAVEGRSGRRVLARAHALFSAALLVASVGTGLARQAGVPVRVVLSLVAAALVGLTLLVARYAPGSVPDRQPPASGRRRVLDPRVVAVAGGLAALALVVENGLQQWAAVFLENVLRAGPALASLGPAMLAGSAVAGRLAAHTLQERIGDIQVLVVSGVLAAPGAVLVGTAGSPPQALSGLVLAGAGVSMAAPTLYGLVGGTVPAHLRGRAVAAVTAVAYVGLLGGPGLVGQVAGLSSLRVGIGVLAIAAVAVALGAPLLRRILAAARPAAGGRAAAAGAAGGEAVAGGAAGGEAVAGGGVAGGGAVAESVAAAAPVAGRGRARR